MLGTPSRCGLVVVGKPELVRSSSTEGAGRLTHEAVFKLYGNTDTSIHVRRSALAFMLYDKIMLCR